MEPFEMSKLLKPLLENMELTDGCWGSDTEISFNIPVYFNPDEYFEGVHVHTNENEDYINLYLSYDFEDNMVTLFGTYNYAIHSKGGNGYDDFTFDIPGLDDDTRKHLEGLLKPERDKYIRERWDEFANVPFNDSKPDTDMSLENDWWLFKAGTSREEIWHWFDDNYSKGVYHLLYKGS